MRPSFLVIALLTAVTLSGCAEEAATEESPFQVDKLDVDADTGGIRGVVVDPSITPIADVAIALNSGEETTTDADGVFTFTGLEPGTYFVSADKLRYESTQSSTQVVAGVEEPPILTIQLAPLVGMDPYLQSHQFDGFYDCAFAAPFITDSCDMAVRTAHDEGAPVPRSVQNNVNTEYLAIDAGAQTIIQEGFYDDSVTARFWSMLSSTPIDNGCDCSDVDYLSNVGEDGSTFDRKDRSAGDALPAVEGEEVAVRGFIPWYTESDPGVDYALGLEFQIFTTVFYNHEAPDGWTLETRDQYPAPQ